MPSCIAPSQAHWLVILAVSGCFSASLLQEPRPMPLGKVRVAVGAEMGKETAQPTMGVRVGVAPRTEARLKLGPAAGGVGVEVGLNVQALDSPFVDLMLMPNFFHYDVDDFTDEEPGTELIGMGLPLVTSVSLDSNDQFQLFAAPDALLLGSPASAQAPVTCPARMYAQPEKCQKYEQKLALRAAREAVRAEERAQLVAYGREHPLRLGVVIQVDGLLLGMGDGNVASAWSMTSGLSLQRIVSGQMLARIEALGRIGKGRIDSWDFENGGAISDHTGIFGGAELHGELLLQANAFYFGPVLSLGLLHLRGQTLREETYPRYSSDGDRPDRVHIPDNAAYLAGGFAIGGQSVPESGLAVGLRFLIGAWNDMHHPYLQAALNVTVKVWD